MKNADPGLSSGKCQHFDPVLRASWPTFKMSLSAAASALAPNPRAERCCEQGHEYQSRKQFKQARDCFAQAVELTRGQDKVYCFALAQSELSCKNIPAAVAAFQLSHAAAPDWFAPKEALRMLGAPLVATAQQGGKTKK